MNNYKNVRVVTQCLGLTPIGGFDAVEMAALVDQGDGDFEATPDLADPSAGGFSVRLHIVVDESGEGGGVDTVADFWFDPSEPGEREKTLCRAQELAISMADMILMARPDLAPVRVMGADLAANPRFITAQSSEGSPGVSL